VPILILLVWVVLLAAAPAPLNQIQVENELPGTVGWQLSKPSDHGEIQGYSGQDSIQKGQSVDFYVSTRAPSFSIAIYRMGYYQGKGGALKYAKYSIPGQNQGSYVYPPNIYPSDCDSHGHCDHSIVSHVVDRQETHLVDANWQKSLTVNIPTSWVTGYYLAKVWESSTGTQWHIPFVVRDDTAHPDLLYEQPFDCDQAYNSWGGASYYRDLRPNDKGLHDRAVNVSYNRPYTLANGTEYFFFWEYPMIRFLEEKGYNVGYTTNVAVSSGQTNLLNCGGFLTAGHDEYVSQAERKAIEDAWKQGINIAYFGANDVFWQTRHEADLKGDPDRNLVCYKQSLNTAPMSYRYYDPVKALGPLGVPLTTDLWSSTTVHYPQNILLKTNYRGSTQLGGAFDFVVTNSGSWIFAGTGLQDGDHIPEVIGREVDVVSEYRLNNLQPGEKATVVGTSPFLDTANQQYIANAVLVEEGATNSIVFDAGSITWPVGLSDFPTYLHSHPDQEGDQMPPVPQNENLRIITTNILNRMCQPGHAGKL
jgi:hypothetical protein